MPKQQVPKSVADVNAFINDTLGFLGGIDGKDLEEEEIEQLARTAAQSVAISKTLLETEDAPRDVLESIYDLNAIMGRHMEKQPRMFNAELRNANSHTNKALAAALKKAERPLPEHARAPLGAATMRVYGLGEKLDISTVNFDDSSVYLAFKKDAFGGASVAELAPYEKSVVALKLTTKTVRNGVPEKPEVRILPRGEESIDPVLEVGRPVSYVCKAGSGTMRQSTLEVRSIVVMPNDRHGIYYVPDAVREFESA
ncbi:MAG: hypothetical protein M1321_02010 [Candidatus Marsarchaeota archaeon]|nr:hypothetical protein [Candidatus Marsarchaeota archaeon]